MTRRLLARHKGRATNRAAWILAVAWLSGIGHAGAQDVPRAAPAASPRDPLRAGAFEVSASALWLASSSLGSSDANLVSNNTSGSDYRLFSASGNFQDAAGVEARAGYHVTRMFAVEGGVTYSRPAISVTVSNDVEGAAGFTATGETASQFFVDAALVVYPMRRGIANGRVQPFVDLGAGYLRELHGQTGATSGYAALQTGQVYHVGGGARYYFRTRRSGVVRAYGLRFDGRYYVRNGGFSFDGSHARTFTAGAGIVVGF
jgi:hypothetical protein